MNVNDKGFLHDIVRDFIVNYPKLFLEIVRAHYDYIWAKGDVLFVRPELFYGRGFFDVFMVIEAPYRKIPDQSQRYYLFIEVKTGRVDIRQLRKEFKHRGVLYIGDMLERIGCDGPRKDVLVLVSNNADEIRKNCWESVGYHASFHSVELKYLMPFVVSKIEDCLKFIRRKA